MKETTKEHLRIFKAEFLRWVDRFGLKSWECHFTRGKLENDISQITSSSDGCIAKIVLCSSWNDELIRLNKKELLASAKHEAIHLLLARYSHAAQNRYSRLEDLLEREEEVVRILEKLL